VAETSSWIVNTTAATFEKDVIARSMEVPVVVDFWAPWCEPCRQLAPLLEKLANEQSGKFVLVKVDIDQAPEIAQAFGVQSIPYVVALREGQPVDNFMGILPEDQLREWLKSILPLPAEQLLKEGLALEPDDPKAAEAKYREAAHLMPDVDTIQLRLAAVLLAQRRADECSRIITKLEERGFLEPEAEKIKSQLELIEAAAEAGGVDEARKAAAANPDDLSLRIKLADALAVSNKHEEALQICLDVIRQDRTGAGVEAKEAMVKMFDMLGPGSELTSEYRRKLATALY